MDNAEIQSVLQSLGERLPSTFPLVLVGGSALALLGSPLEIIGFRVRQIRVSIFPTMLRSGTNTLNSAGSLRTRRRSPCASLIAPYGSIQRKIN